MRTFDYATMYPHNHLSDGRDVRMSVYERMRAPRRINVVDACKLHMRVSTPGGYDGPWSDQITPYMREPLNATTSREHEAVVFVGVAQSGKGLFIHTVVPTPTGWTTMGEIKEGDYILGAAGKPVRVIAAHPVKNLPCFEVCFSDGTKVVTDNEHLWTVERHYSRAPNWRMETLSTEQMVGSVLYGVGKRASGTDKSRFKYRVYNAQPLDLPEVKLPVDPYLLGVWLGNGHSNGARITSNAEDVAFFEAQIRDAGYAATTTYTQGRSAGNTSINPGFRAALNTAGVLGNKHIPAAYLRASYAQRQALLQGLMDTDGYNGGVVKSACEFSTVNDALKDGFLELCRTLGLKPIAVEKETTWVYKGERKHGRAWRISFSCANGVVPFRSPRKLSGFAPAFDKKVTYRSIVSITPIQSVPTRCIGVDAPDSLFLAGEGMVPTHNTASLAEGLITYSVVVDPSDCTLIMPSKDSARDFSKRRLERLIRNSPDIKDRICIGADDNLLDKVTTSGAMITIGWPTVSQLASKNLKRVILSDIDRMPLDIGGEGDAFSLARKRTQSFMSAGMVVAESTPGWDIVDREWREPDPDDHIGPPVSGGVVTLFNQGTRERFYWTCPHCSEKFRAEMQYFRWDDLDDPIEASQTAHMVCPHCGSVINETDKAGLNAKGEWLAEGWRTGSPRMAKIRSFWMHGVAAAFQRWQSLAYNMIVARKEYLDTGATERLKTVTNVDWGLPFMPPATTAQRDATALLALAEAYPLKTVPEQARFLIASVDLQKNRFVLQVVAHGPERERWVIDRVNLTESPRVQGDGSFARVEPFNYVEDFEVISKVLTERKYPHALGGEMGIRLLTMDTGGQDDASVNAYTFWRKCAALGIADKVMLVKGNGSSKAKRLTRSSAQKVDAVPLWIIGSNQIKTEISFDMARSEPGPGKIHLSSQLEPWFFDELAAEEQDIATGLWVKKNPKARNEAFDLISYDAAGLIALGTEGFNWKDEKTLPEWAQQRKPIAEKAKTDQVAAAGFDWATLAKSMNG